ncbi:MAG: hypothetical protein QM520_07040 [Gammaproteobacteria bacterium]|nr:hypothetical protein [Gammaproteobacteria bacterium]
MNLLKRPLDLGFTEVANNKAGVRLHLHFQCCLSGVVPITLSFGSSAGGTAHGVTTLIAGSGAAVL